MSSTHSYLADLWRALAGVICMHWIYRCALRLSLSLMVPSMYSYLIFKNVIYAFSMLYFEIKLKALQLWCLLGIYSNEYLKSGDVKLCLYVRFICDGAF